MKSNWMPTYKPADYEYTYDVDSTSRSAPKAQPQAYCDNTECVYRNRYVRNLGVRKNVEKGVDWCPDCGYALYWKV